MQKYFLGWFLLFFIIIPAIVTILKIALMIAGETFHWIFHTFHAPDDGWNYEFGFPWVVLLTIVYLALFFIIGKIGWKYLKKLQNK